MCVCVCVIESVCVCVCVCVRGRDKDLQSGEAFFEGARLFCRNVERVEEQRPLLLLQEGVRDNYYTRF